MVGKAGGNKDVSLYFAADVEEQDNEAFNFWVEVGIGADVHIPVARCLCWCRAFVHGAGERAFAQGDEPPFLRLSVASELLRAGGSGFVDSLHHGRGGSRFVHVSLGLKERECSLRLHGESTTAPPRDTVRRPDGREFEASAAGVTGYAWREDCAENERKEGERRRTVATERQ